MADQSPSPLSQRFFRTCLLVLGGVVALSVALDLLARFWGWVALITIVVLILWVGISFYRWWRDRR